MQISDFPNSVEECLALPSARRFTLMNALRGLVTHEDKVAFAAATSEEQSQRLFETIAASRENGVPMNNNNMPPLPQVPQMQAPNGQSNGQQPLAVPGQVAVPQPLPQQAPQQMAPPQPAVPQLPNMPQVPGVPQMQQGAPQLPQQVPQQQQQQVPQVPQLPQMLPQQVAPQQPQLPQMAQPTAAPPQQAAPAQAEKKERKTRTSGKAEMNKLAETQKELAAAVKQLADAQTEQNELIKSLHAGNEANALATKSLLALMLPVFAKIEGQDWKQSAGQWGTALMGNDVENLIDYADKCIKAGKG